MRERINKIFNLTRGPSFNPRGGLNGRGRGAARPLAADFLVSSQTQVLPEVSSHSQSQSSQSRKRTKISPEKSKQQRKYSKMQRVDEIVKI